MIYVVKINPTLITSRLDGQLFIPYFISLTEISWTTISQEALDNRLVLIWRYSVMSPEPVV